MIKSIILFGTVVLFLFSMVWNCHHKNRNTGPKELTNINTVVQEEVKVAAYQTINSWLDEGIEGIQFLRTSKWKIDDQIFLNSRNDKGYLLLLNQDKAASAELDYVQVLYAAKEDERWNIYLASLPNLVVPRKRKNGAYILNTFDHLSAVGVREIGLHLIKGQEANNDKYISKEFNKDLKKNHELFLLRKIRK